MTAPSCESIILILTLMKILEVFDGVNGLASKYSQHSML